MASLEEIEKNDNESITAFTKFPLADEEQIVLSDEQFARFVQILEDPAPPAPALMRAMQDYKATKSAHTDRGL